MERRLAAGDQRGPARVAVDARDLVAERSEAGTGHDAHVAGPDDGDLHATNGVIRQAHSRAHVSQWIFVEDDGTLSVTPRAGQRTRRFTHAPAGMATRSPAPNQCVAPEATSK